MQDTPTTSIKRNTLSEPPRFVELFQRLQAKYRSQGVHTVSEWSMDTQEGRESYRRSNEREAFLAKLNNAKEVLTRAEERLAIVPYGSVIDFDSLMYGKEVQ